MSIRKREDNLREIFGAEGLLDEILQALSYSEKKEIFDYIERMHDINNEEDGE